MTLIRYLITGALLACLSILQGIAQPALFSENFDAYPYVSYTYPWSATGGTGGFRWRCDVAYNTFGLGYLYFPDKSKIALTLSNGHSLNELLTTPAFSNAPGAYLSYDSYFEHRSFNGVSEAASVEVSADNGATWTVVHHPPVCNGRYMRRSYVSLAAAGNAGSIRLGFRYSDSLQYLLGWMVDNIRVYVPAANDIALLRAGPEDSMLSYYAVPSGMPLQGTVMNMGTTPITAFDVYYQEGTGPVQRHSVTGVSIAPFDTLDFTHSVPVSLSAVGRHALKVWVSATGDTSHANDTLAVMIHGAAFIPKKKVVIEEGTGTWNVYAPRGIVYLHLLDTAGVVPLRISVHSGDPMEVKPYKDFLYYLNQNFTPYFLFDRRGPVPYPYFFETYQREQAYFGFADLEVSGIVSGSRVSVNAAVKPAVDLPGKYRLALVLTEDGVQGISADYNQANVYAGGGEGPMGGWESKPNPVPALNIKYDYVARSISPAPEGAVTCLPQNMTAAGSYNCTLQATLATDWNRSRLTAIVLLISERDSSILNARAVPLKSLSVPASLQAGGMQLAPNPADGSATVSIQPGSYAQSTIQVTDMLGRIVFQNDTAPANSGPQQYRINTTAWPAGIYLVTFRCGEAKETLRLSVLH